MKSGFLVGKEFVVKPFGSETLVGIDDQGFSRVPTRVTTANTRLAQLVDDTGIALRLEKFYINWATPVILVVWFVLRVGALYIYANRVVVEIPVIGY